MSISERATANVTPYPRNEHDIDRLREEWRLLAKEWSAAKDNADRLSEGKKILLAEMIIRLTKDGMSRQKAEDEALASTQFKEYVRKMHDAKRQAQDLFIDAENADRLYWRQNNAEATQRSERRMSR